MNDSPREQGFFRWIRELGLQRGSDNWAGGVCTGVAQRFGVSPILIRGIAVALCLVAGIGLLAYGLAWALLPDENGHIHLQEAIAGRWSSGMSGALVFFIIGAVGSPSLFSWWDGGFLTLLIVLGICLLVFSRRGSFAARGDGAEPGKYQEPGVPFTTAATTTSAATETPSERPPSTMTFSPSVAPERSPRASSSIPVSADPEIAPDAALDSVSPLGAALPTDPSSTKTTGATAYSLQEGTKMLPSHETPPGESPGSQPPPYTRPGAPTPEHKPRAPRNKAIPGYAATIVLGLAVLGFAMVAGLERLDMLQLPANPLAIAFAVALVIIALGVIGAALNRRTGGALVGFGIVALVFSLIWGGGSLREGGTGFRFPGVITTESSGSENVFHSGELDLRSYSTITSDTTVDIENVFSSMELTLPDNIPVAIDTQGAFSSLQINGDAPQIIEDGRTVLNADAGGPTLTLQLDGAFSSIEINIAKAEVAP